jgi:uncharacterized UPF0160 family protein
MKTIPKSFGTHDGHFHADELTACALLINFELIQKELIFRTRDEKILSSCQFVCDVGGIYDHSKKRFDHHQNDYAGSLSSAGMILKFLKDEKIISPELFNFLNNYFILGVDAHDTGNVKLVKGFLSFSQLIENFVPLGDELENIALDKAFYGALDFVLGFLKRLIARFYYLQQTREIVKKYMQKKDKCLVFDKAISWVESFFELGGADHPAIFIIMPSGPHWKLRAIPPTYEDRMNVRVPLPMEWAGLRGESLQKASGVKGAVFCHKGRFISIWETKEDALKALEYVLKKEGLE